MLAQRLKHLRAIKDMTQADLAKLLGITQQAVAKWERGKAEPDNDTLKKLADFFHVSIDYILGHESSTDTIRNMLGAEKPDPKKELLYALIRRIPHKKLPEAQALLEVLARNDYNNMA